MLILVIFLLCSQESIQRVPQSCGLYIISMIWAFTIEFEELNSFDGWKNINSEEKINHRLIIRNTSHLAQSSETPFASGFLGEAVGSGQFQNSFWKVTRHFQDSFRTVSRQFEDNFCRHHQKISSVMWKLMSA